MQCPRCRQDNPPAARFCADCGARLASACAGCGAELPARARFCPSCARPLGAPPLDDGRFAAPNAYTPKHLAERILTSRAAIEGERKQVTVLFADLKGSMELLAERDPEEARRLLDPVLESLMEAVHRYEGTVNQVMGDGIMALFGAPLAHEDHALRACYSALRMQESVRRLVEARPLVQQLPIQIRVGLNSGEVVVRAIGSDLRMDYSAVGQTTHLAARMEQLASPGHTLLTEQTRRLVEGYVAVRPLGPTSVKGLSDPVEVYELTGAGAARSRLQAAAARGFTRFVGRDGELADLARSLDRAGGGRGQVVAVVGEPGVGKSRLIAEFVHAQVPPRWRVVETATVSYGKNVPYLPVVGLLRSIFQIEDGEDAVKVRDKVTTRLLAFGESMGGAREAVLALLDVGIDEPAWTGLDPSERRQRILDALRRILLRESQEQPLCVVCEDLQWVDSETQAVLDSLVDSLPAARLLLIISYRPEYQHGWTSKTYYSQFQVGPLSYERAGELLRHLLGANEGLAGLAHLLIERTEGNPFFIEETVRELAETGALEGARGAHRPAGPLGRFRVPPTVQAVLASRIDRLPLEDKALLETAAVIGRDVPFALLEALHLMPEAELRRRLGRLREAEFLYEAALFPEPAYAFKHALTLEVAYGSLLHDRRRALHAAIVDAIERVHAGRLREQAETLAHHAVRGEVWDKAVDHLRHAAGRAYGRGAIPETLDRYEEALRIIPRLPESLDNTRRAIDIRLDLHGPLMVLGRVARLSEVGQEAELLARALGDAPRLGRVLYQMGYHAWLSARYGSSVECAKQVLAIATAAGDAALRVRATHLLGLNRLALGAYPEAIELLSRVADVSESDVSPRRLALLMTYVDACGWLSFCLAAVGDFDEALRYADRGVGLADLSQHPQAQAIAYGFRAIPPIIRGDFAQALPWCERAGHLCETKAVLAWRPTVYSFWGWALAWLGRPAEGLGYLELAARTRERMGAPTHLALFHYRWGEALLLAGRIDDARRAAERARELAEGAGERSYEASALQLLGDIAAGDPPDPPAATGYLERAKALAHELGARPVHARARLSLGGVLAAQGRVEAARAELGGAAEMFGAMGMEFWLARARSALEKLGT